MNSFEKKLEKLKNLCKKNEDFFKDYLLKINIKKLDELENLCEKNKDFFKNYLIKSNDKDLIHFLDNISPNIDYEISLFDPIDNKWLTLYSEQSEYSGLFKKFFDKYSSLKNGGFFNDEDESLICFDEICSKLKITHYSKIKLEKIISLSVYEKKNNSGYNIEINTEIIKEFEFDIEIIEKICAFCKGRQTMVGHRNNVEFYNDIKNGLKKNVSPCNSLNNNCICNECDIVWFCEDCSEDVVLEIQLDEKYDVFGITLNEIKKYYKEEKENAELF
jgi:hypothetical protein